MGFNKVIPSIASVVASLNRHATIYCERSRLQAHRTEIIQVGHALQPGAVQLPKLCLLEPLQAAGAQGFLAAIKIGLVFM